MKKRLAVIYGGITTEHEVSIVTAVQMMENVDQTKYDLVPLYIDKAGQWWTGKELLDIKYYQQADLFKPKKLEAFHLHPVKDSNQIDVAILCFHGGYGESGNVQGLLELAGIPYQGPKVLSSAIAFDKVVTRQILAAEEIGQTDYVWFNDFQWKNHREQLIQEINQLQYPLFIKPARSGSSIGIQKIKTQAELEKTVEEVMQYDYRVLIESEVQDCIEVNVSVLGGETIKASVPEQPISTDQFLSFADKYEKGNGKGGEKSGLASANRRIPAPISSQLAEKIQSLAKDIFRIFDCTGVVRIDFFANPSTEEVFVTELNTIPGSMSYYLWQASGLAYPDLIDRLVEIAEEEQLKKEQLITSFESNILDKDF